MGKQRNTVLVLGEGPTEFFYFNSLCDVFKGLTVKPDSPKHTSINEFEKKIKCGIEMGYSHIFCVMDMDNKDNEVESHRYKELKARYDTPVKRSKYGDTCTVDFFETHRCTELFFLYYFLYTSKAYTDQNMLLADLKKHVEYSKSCDFFKKTKGLHSYFLKNNGNFDRAIQNACRSMDEKGTTGRDYTYSDLGRLMQNLYKLSSK